MTRVEAITTAQGVASLCKNLERILPVPRARNSYSIGRTDEYLAKLRRSMSISGSCAVLFHRKSLEGALRCHQEHEVRSFASPYSRSELPT